MDHVRDPALDAARYRASRDDAPATEAPPVVDVAGMAERHGRRESEVQEQDRRRRDRAATQHLWVERQIIAAQERGDFDNLPGAGRPIPGLTNADPDWWVRSLVERERLTGMGFASVNLREEDRAMDARLDALRSEDEVRATIADFNSRVLAARAAPAAGPPLVTPTRDPAAEIARWRERNAR